MEMVKLLIMKYITAITVGFLFSYFWLILPESRYMKNPFPFFKMQIAIQNYFDYLGSRIFYAILAWVMFDLSKTVGYQGEMRIVFVLLIGFVIDYILCYNQPYGWICKSGIVFEKPSGFFIPMSYSLVMGVCLVLMAVISWATA